MFVKNLESYGEAMGMIKYIHLLTKKEKDDIENYRRECNIRRYKKMNIGVARSIMRNLKGNRKHIFIKKINAAKGYEFI